VALAVLVGLLGACANPAGPGGAAASPSPSPNPTAAATALTITVTPSPAASPLTWTLSCGPADGTHPNPAAACDFVARTAARLLAPVPADLACTKIYGGPAVATISGMWRGLPVNARLARQDGCEIARWDRLEPLIGDGAA